ncbi:MAG TPA: molybdate ABC transporter substrate-binding protein [Candidatus Baltobacteraceae bacterium]|nr:molybdate ABC transporter substrate-binding protein [Candidatus Baltobacteraceae bacterium]
MKSDRRVSGVVLTVAAVLAACSGAATATPTPIPATPTPTVPPASASPATTPASGSLTIYAASSLTAAFTEMKTAYQNVAPGITMTLSFGASSTLEAQIEQGAPADVFASADTSNPQKLVDKGLAAGSITTFAGNLLTVIVPLANPAGVQTPADLAKAGLKFVAAGDTVPITKYADMLLANLAQQPGYPAGYVAAVTANIVSKEDNVAAVVSKIELGEGDAAIVYVTDADTAGAKVMTISVPAAANVPATYGAVAIKASPNAAAAAALITWLAGPGGQAILAKYGFLPPG